MYDLKCIMFETPHCHNCSVDSHATISVLFPGCVCPWLYSLLYLLIILYLRRLYRELPSVGICNKDLHPIELILWTDRQTHTQDFQSR